MLTTTKPQCMAGSVMHSQVSSRSLGSSLRRGSTFLKSKAQQRGPRSVVIRADAVETLGTTSRSSVSSSSTVLSIVLGGGAGTRLYPLTATRAKPAVNIGGAYRLIDVPMSNCINSGINKIYILTQFNSTSLNRHLSRCYNVGGNAFGGDAFVEVLAATQTPSDKDWFKGTADAVRQYSWLIGDIKNRSVEDVCILSGDHLYRMDYMKFVNHHRETNADITVGALPCDYERASSFGLMRCNDEGRILDFAEKPEGEELEAMKVDTTKLGLSEAEAAEQPFMASMGIYVFKKKVLLDLLANHPEKHDFGGEIIPDAKDDLNVSAYLFKGYWEDIGTIKSFFDANLALTQQPPKFEFYDPVAPIYTSSRFLPPAKVEKCHLVDAIVGHGANVADSSIEHSIIGLRSRIGKGCTIRDAIIMGNDSYESDSKRKELEAAGRVPLGVGEGTHLQNCIVDKNARIGRNVSITNKEGVEESNREEQGIYIRSGIVVVYAGAEIPDGTQM